MASSSGIANVVDFGVEVVMSVLRDSLVLLPTYSMRTQRFLGLSFLFFTPHRLAERWQQHSGRHKFF